MEVAFNAFDFFASIGFVLVGTVVFQISALISGYNIYKEKESNEASLISIAVGMIIFLLSPITFIILYPIPDYKPIDNFFEIISFESISPFLISAIGFGLIFGYLSMLRIRRMALMSIRDFIGIPFWIFDYAMEWDDFLTAIKREGKITIHASNGKVFTGDFLGCSCRDQPNEVHLRDSGGNQILVLGDTITDIEVIGKSINKHMESQTHISQALNCLMAAIGIYLLSCSSYMMIEYIRGRTYLESALMNYMDVINYYSILKYIFIIFYILILIFAFFLAKKDFNNFTAYIYFCPDFLFMLIFGTIMTIYLMDSSSRILTNSSLSKDDFYIIVIFILIIYLYVRKLIKNVIYKKLKNTIKNLVETENDKIKIYRELEIILKYLYLNLDFNDPTRSKLEAIKDEVIDKFNADKILIEKLFSQIADLKTENKYLEDEDINILWCLKNKILKNLLKKTKCI
jgi:hypothetical protein